MSRRILISLSLLLQLLFSTGAAYPVEKIIWHDFNSGMVLAQKSGRPVFIFFYADWCGYCKMMDDVNFRDEKTVKILNSTYVSIRLNVDLNMKSLRYNNGTYSPKELFPLMNGSVLPYMTFLESSGSMITGIDGFVQKEIFSPFLEYVSIGCYKTTVTFDDYMEDKSRCSKK